MGTKAEIRAWVKTTEPHNWYGQCAGLTMSIARHFGVLDGGPYPSAYAAYLASKIESTDPSKCPPGGIHYWDGFFRGSQGGYARYGHVAVDIDGGGTAVLSATSQAAEFWGRNAGLISIARQSALIRNNPEGRYLGWSRTYGTHRVAITTLAGGNSRPVPEEDDMAWDDKLPNSSFTYGEAFRLLFWENTGGIVGKKSDGAQVKRDKQILALVRANDATIDALSDVIARLAAGTVTKAEIIKAVRDSTTAEVKKALKDIEIDVTVSTGAK